MPNNITDVVTYTAPIVAPADGDAETGASVQAGLQGLANRTALANSVLNSTGVVLLRTGSAATMAALSMSAGQAGQIFYVSGKGIFEYKNPSVLTVDSQWVFTAAGAASGQWVHELYQQLNASSGIPVIGSIGGVGTANRIPASVVPYGNFLTPYYNAGPVFMSTSSTSLVALTGTPTITLGLGAGGLLAGDVVELVAPALYTCAAACQVMAMVSENGGAFFSAAPYSGYNLQLTGGTAAAATLSFIRTVATPGNYQIQFQGLTLSAPSALSVTASTVYARVFRP